MYLAYVDECGDPGYNSSVPIFGLATILVDDQNWYKVLNEMIKFRRHLRDQFGIRMRAEIKANHLIHNKGCFKKLKLNSGQRRSIYRMHLGFLENCKLLKVWSCVVIKSRIKCQSSVDPRGYAWKFMLQRYERFGTMGSDNVMVFPDEGHSFFIRKKARKMRRHNRPKSSYGNGTLNRDAINIIEDPNDRDSDRSYFIQFADLLAYAAYRRLYELKNTTKTTGFDRRYWDILDNCLDKNVTSFKKSKDLKGEDLDGMVVWPRK